MGSLEAPAAVSAGELVLGRYRPVRPLGSGGSGSVWLARDERTGLDVALKIVTREGKAGSRAEREASAAARLRHEHCLRAYAFARDSQHVYIVYEYVPGTTMRDALRAGELNDAAALAAAAQVLDGLAHAHAHGIVHRDVKPSNVLLADANEVSVRLLDFGLALVREEDTLTAVGDVPGTLAYISPERLAGETAEPAADIWSVGVMLWEALAGQHPFWTASLLDTARAIERGAPPLATMRPDLPKHVLAAVDAALAVDPARRPPAAKLASVLRRSREQRAVHSARRRPVLAAPPFARVVPAAAAGLYAGWSAATIPFFPSGFPVALSLVAALLALVRERAGLALALAVPVFPLGNLSLGLALVYAVLASAWLAFSWREPRAGLFLVAGPLLAPVGALGLLPLAAQPVRNGVRRAAQVAGAVLLAAIVAGLRHVSLPLGAGPPPLGLGIEGSGRPFAVAEALAGALAAHPVLLAEALVLAGASLALPAARRRGLWGIACFGAALLAGTLLPSAGASPLSLVLTTWLTCGLLAWRETGVHARALAERIGAAATLRRAAAGRAGAG